MQRLLRGFSGAYCNTVTLGGTNSGGNIAWGHTSLISTVLLRGWPLNWMEIHILLTMLLRTIKKEQHI